MVQVTVKQCHTIVIVFLFYRMYSRIMATEPEYRKILKTDLENINYNLITYIQDRLEHDARYAIDPSKYSKGIRMVSKNTICNRNRKNNKMVFR